MQRDRRNERPRSHHRVRLRRLRRSRARLRSLLRLTGALDVPASSANIRHARGHQGAFARRHLVGSPNAKTPQPMMLSSQRGPTEDEDGRWTMRPDAIASSGSLSRRNCSSDHTRSRADSGYTWRGRCYSRRPSRRPETQPHWELHSSRGDDDSDARPKRQK